MYSNKNNSLSSDAICHSHSKPTFGKKVMPYDYMDSRLVVFSSGQGEAKAFNSD